MNTMNEFDLQFKKFTQVDTTKEKGNARTRNQLKHLHKWIPQNLMLYLMKV